MSDRFEPARRLARGVQVLFDSMGYASMTEVKLRSRRRVDVMGINDKGRILIAEVKSGPADFRADSKWPEYLDFCDEFFFAVDEQFPVPLLPEDQGLILSDGFMAGIIRPSAPLTLNAARRKNMTLRFARQAAQRLRMLDGGS
ncbi:MmcB family DNA repair protein [Sneathiella chinensis]|uniref:DNA repair protein MmcB-related protein n=1 Tax=Sneathiella chinensis TaxID=349750 RepID=A0ABQ5U0T1_9PROT|nr:MmcB family DNA repair protein [Sneathiella chinensis]GLQ04923.1 hypothetical protein GCM10007924_01440 [Sneathiella chinensis]